MNYRVEHLHWVSGNGFSYSETIDNVSKILSEDELKEGYESYCINDGDQIRLYDEDDNMVSCFELEEK